LNVLLYKGEFPRKNIPGSTYANFSGIYDRLFRRIRVKESFFAQLSFFGHLVTREAGLMEVDPEIFGAVKHAVRDTQIEYVQGDIVRSVAHGHENYDFVSISDVPSFLPPASEALYLRDMRPRLSPGAIVVARGNLRIVAPEAYGYEDISAKLAELGSREKTQLWTVNAFKRTGER
jgi:S-adenosylmethionine-diacylglycerol 3-amino-3-carboxypropyl transferase